MKLLFIECKRVGGSAHTIGHLSFDIADDGDGGARGGWGLLHFSKKDTNLP